MEQESGQILTSWKNLGVYIQLEAYTHVQRYFITQYKFVTMFLEDISPLRSFSSSN